MEDLKTLAMANTYRMTERDIRLLIQLRATNAAIFTGKKHSAMRGWRAIRKEMGLQGMLSARQLKKKWDNLKEKYKTLKNPPEGMETTTHPSSWRWFHLMDEATSGRLAGTATIVEPSLQDEDEEHNRARPRIILHNTERDCSQLIPVEAETLERVGMFREGLDLNESGSPVEVITAGGGSVETQPVMKRHQPATARTTSLQDGTTKSNETASFSRQIVEEAAKVDQKLQELRKERQLLEREQAEFDRELISMERDRELLKRDLVNLERDRAAIEQDRAAVERERVVLDRDRAFLDRDRAFLERDRVFLERAREDLERDRSLLRTHRTGLDGDQAEMTTEKEVLLQTRFYQSLMAADLDQDQLETRQRLVSLFQKLVEKL